jgi:hypothetical protein
VISKTTMLANFFKMIINCINRLRVSRSFDLFVILEHKHIILSRSEIRPGFR